MRVGRMDWPFLRNITESVRSGNLGRDIREQQARVCNYLTFPNHFLHVVPHHGPDSRECVDLHERGRHALCRNSLGRLIVRCQFSIPADLVFSGRKTIQKEGQNEKHRQEDKIGCAPF